MVNELRDLLRDNVAAPPPDDGDLVSVLASGRRRVRRRRRVVLGGVALATAGVVSVGLVDLAAPLPAGPGHGRRADARPVRCCGSPTPCRPSRAATTTC